MSANHESREDLFVSLSLFFTLASLRVHWNCHKIFHFLFLS